MSSAKEDEDLRSILDYIQVSASPKYSSKSNLKCQLPDDEQDFPQSNINNAVTFDKVTVYYFPRAQGFTSVPSRGGCTLGMTSQHAHVQHFSILEYAVEKRRLHRQTLLELRSERLNAQGAPIESRYDSVSEEGQSNISESRLDFEGHSFLQPVPPRQREALLRAAGITKIDPVEKDECTEIRSSRKLCGCRCKGCCDPDTCSCSQAGIKCQVEDLNFPCGCSHYGCANSSGRIEFDPVRVRKHFIHTLMRVAFENKQKLKEGEEEGEQKRSPRCSNSSSS
jgi:cysteine/serine-rich nuclear protein